MPKFHVRALTCAAALALVAPSAGASTVNGDYQFTILSQERSIQGNEFYSDSVMLEDGSIATIVRDIGNRSSVPHRIRIHGPDGRVVREIVAPSADLSFGNGSGQGLSINARGQIAVAAFLDTGSVLNRRRQLLLIEPDNTVRVLIDAPAVQPEGVADATLGVFSDVKINETGDVAVVGSFRRANGRTDGRVLKITDTSGAAPTSTILDETSARGTPSEEAVNVLFEVAIDDSGTVAWTRTRGDAREVVLADGASERVALFSESEFSSLRQQYRSSALTNSGLLAIASVPGTGSPRTVGTSDVTNGLADEDYDPAFTTARNVERWDANEFGQTFALRDAQTAQNGGVIVEGEFIAETGLIVEDFELSRAGNFDGFFRAANGEFSNDAGQLAFEAWGRADLDGNPGIETYNLVIRADPIGATPDHPILPASQIGNIASLSYEIVNGLGLDTPIYVDPDPAAQFDYMLNSGPAITSLLIPDQDLGAEDGIFEILFGGFSESIVFGEMLDFTAFAGFSDGVLMFSIAGIDAGAGVTTDTPFVVGLTHAGLGEVDLTITGRTADVAPVPLPAAGWLLGGALAAMLWGVRRRPSAV